MSIVDFNNNGYSNIKFPKSLLKTIRKAILLNINHKFKKNNFHSYESFFKFLKKISDRDFKDKFGLQVWRILDSHNTKKINNWVEKVIPKQLNCKKASLNIITKSEYNKNNYLKNEQYCAFYRVVRRDKKDVTKPHKDSSFWKLGIRRKANFKHNSVCKLWVPIMGVTKQNTLNLIKSSHKDDVKILYKKIDGLTKPKVSDTYIKKNRHRVVKPIKTDGTESLMFHADTIHFANINTTTDFRVSLEFNILVK